MKEYKIQMRYKERYNGEWVSGKFPDGRSLRAFPYTSREEAEKKVEYLRKEYPAYAKKFIKCVPENLSIKELPIDFRILSREVTEWETDNE